MRRNPDAHPVMITSLMLLILFSLFAPVYAEVPHLLNYQGKLTDSLGAPMDTTVAMQFYIYSDSVSGTQLWTESHGSVMVERGLFEVLLGSTTPIPTGVFNGNDRWLALAVGKDPAGEPRTRIVSSAYAYHAHRADTADYALSAPGTGGAGGWVDTGTRVRLETAGDSVGIGTSTPSERLHLQGNFMLSNDYDIKFGTTGSQIDQVSTDLVIDVADDLHLQPADNIYIRQGTDPTFMIIDPGSKNVGIGIASPEDMVHIDNNASGGSAFLRVETSHATNWHEAGLRIETPQNRWHLRMDDDSNNQLPDGALGLRTQDYNMEVMTWTDDGKIGIGTTNPQQKLHVNGNVYADGALDVTGNADVEGNLDVYGSAVVDDTVFAAALQGALLGPFQSNSIGSQHIIDEPGVTASSGWSGRSLTSSWQVIRSRSITAPGPGYVLAMVDAELNMDHAISGSTIIHYGISDSPDSIPSGNTNSWYQSSSADAGIYSIPAAMSRVFSIPSAGEYSFNLQARTHEPDHDGNVYASSIVLVYFPTSYATSSVPEPSAAIGSAEKIARLSAVDRHGAVSDATAHIAEPVDRQIAELKSELDALKQRLESLENK